MRAYKRRYFESAAPGALVPAGVVRDWLGALIRSHPQPHHQIELGRWTGVVYVHPYDATAGPMLQYTDGSRNCVSLNFCIKSLRPHKALLAHSLRYVSRDFKECARAFLLWNQHRSTSPLPNELALVVLRAAAVWEIAYIGGDEGAN